MPGGSEACISGHRTRALNFRISNSQTVRSKTARIHVLWHSISLMKLSKYQHHRPPSNYLYLFMDVIKINYYTCMWYMVQCTVSVLKSGHSNCINQEHIEPAKPVRENVMSYMQCICRWWNAKMADIIIVNIEISVYGLLWWNGKHLVHQITWIARELDSSICLVYG